MQEIGWLSPLALKDKVFTFMQKIFLFFAGNKLVLKLYENMLLNQVKKGEMPQHVAVILDGNRRWALSRGLDALYGHVEGAKKAEEFFDWCRELEKIRTVTLYLFSTENFKRSRDEVEHLMRLIEAYLKALAEDKRIHENRIRVKVIGKRELLPENLKNCIEKIEKVTENYNNYYLNLAIAYGGRAEIVDAVKAIVSKVVEGKISPEDVNEKVVEEHLYTGFLPNPHPDLVIRTSGEERLSNFLLWQSAYSEFCFLDVYWPNFRKVDFLRAIRVYQQRQRRFGG
mgnify:CR=1 FL=1